MKLRAHCTVHDGVHSWENIMSDTKRSLENAQSPSAGTRRTASGMNLNEKWGKLESKANELRDTTVESSKEMTAATKLLGEEIGAGLKRIGQRFWKSPPLLLR